MNKNKISVSKILEICNGKLLTGDKNTEIESYCNDSRKITKGEMYIGIKGDRVNGNNFIKDAFDNGAIGCITDDETCENIIKKHKNKVVIKVENTIKAIQQIATYKRSLYDIPVIAVTGSVREN